jgi:hypothetical protein
LKFLGTIGFVESSIFFGGVLGDLDPDDELD